MRYIFLLISLLFSLVTSAQVLTPAKWQIQLEAAQPVVGEKATVVITATIDKDWYLYSSDFSEDIGPMVTTFSFVPHPSYKLLGEVQPQKPKSKYDPIWEGEYTYFVGKGVFKQEIEVLQEPLVLETTVKYQVCTDITGRCIPGEETLVLNTKPATMGGIGASAPQKLTRPGDAVTEAAPVTPATADFVEEATEDESFIGFLLAAFLWGIAALFTPCVFPMIPLTVSFFTKRQENGKGLAVIYGLSIVLIYTVIGAILAPIFGPAAANVISTHWLPNLLFFFVFLLFALSFFGMFDIQMPSKLVNAMDAKADKGGIAGVFFMAFTLVLVSFSCTGPIVGSILVTSANGEWVRPVAGMFVFGLSFGLPFMLFAFFPQLMQKLPSSGGWLNSVKVTLGFVELALAFKFLSTADLVYHWGLLSRDLMIAIWIAIAAFMGLYFLGKLRLPHDSPVERISVPRMLLALSSFVFVVYLIPGMFGAPLKLLSGILPPQTAHSFHVPSIVRQQVQQNVPQGNFAVTSKQAEGLPQQVKYSDLFHLPHGLTGYYDYEQALQAAQVLNKPIFIDFTGWGCANCRKMEDNVWADKRVRDMLQNDFVLLALYVDDPTELPQQEWVTSAYDGKLKKTIGAINMDFQITRFDNNAQPYYVIMNPQGKQLIPAKAYDLSVNNFVNFLQTGLSAYEKQQPVQLVKK